MDRSILKKFIIDDFEYMKNMSVREYLTYRKWEQLNSSNWDTVRLYQLKNSLWYPEHPDDYLKIQPDIVFADNKADVNTWSTLRNFIHAQINNQNIGRTLRAFAIDRNSGKYLGVMSLNSDFSVLKPRDNYIGWSNDHRLKFKRLNYLAMGTTICPTQPLGFNYTGGKLMALLTCSDKYINRWNQKYKEQLVGVTTTSLFGRPSQYTRLKHWRDCKETSGRIPLEPSDKVYQEIKEWVKTYYMDKYIEITTVKTGKNNITPRPKTNIISFTLRQLGVKPPDNNSPRGVYFCPLFKDTSEFLRMEKDSVTEPLFDNSLESLFEMWKTRYAKNRIKNTKDNITSPLFYDDMIGVPWLEIKKKYIDK